MKALEFLKKLAVDAKIIKIIDETEQKNPQIETLSISLPHLIRKKELQDNGSAAELNIPFDKIYELYKIKPPAHGWDLDKVVTALFSAGFKKINCPEAKKALQDIVAGNNIDAADIIKDAVSRDQALDAYEQLVYNRIQERIKTRAEKIDSVKQQIKECQQEISQLESAQLQDKEGFQKWIEKKVLKEEELVNVVSLLTSDNLISVGPVSNKKQEKKTS